MKNLLLKKWLNGTHLFLCTFMPLLFTQGLKAEALLKEKQQVRTVTGIVTGTNNEPLPGVNVIEKGTTNGTVTNLDGAYQISVSETSILVFSSVGYVTEELQAGSRTVIDIRLIEDVKQLEELVVVGYGTQRRETLTGSVSSINASEFADVPAVNLSNALAGRLSGVTISQGAGTPGMESGIRIRAVGTFNNEDPLYVIDGIVKDKFAFDGLNANEVESISILKDGAAASIYGSRAANGVVLVTTKRGDRNQAPVLSYNGTFGIQSPTRIPESLTAYEHALAINHQILWNDPVNGPNNSKFYAQDEVDFFKSNSWNWVEEMWQDPINTQHALNVSGGSDNVRYFVAGSYNYSNGSFKNLDYRKLNLRGNIDVDITKNFTASLDLSTDNRKAHGPSWDVGGDGNRWHQQDLYKALVLRTSMVPPYINGIPVGNWVEWHPGEIINGKGGYNNREWTGLNATATLQYNVPFIKGLGVKAVYNRYNRTSYRKQFNLPYNMMYFNTTGEHGHIIGDQPVRPRPRATTDYLYQWQETDFSYQLNFQADYSRTFGRHDINASLIYEQMEIDENNFSARAEDFLTFAIDQFAAANGSRETNDIDGGQEQDARLSYIGVVNYSYDDRYLLQSSFRYDGSVKFAPESRWGFFPSASLGWRMSNESFFNLPFIQELKLRASVGSLGNDDVGSFQWLQSFELLPAEGAVWETVTSGLQPGSLANYDITWEKSVSYNFGVDSRFDRFNLTADVFYRHTYDILGDREESIPSTFGADLPDENYQEIDTRGFEIELGYENATGGTNPFQYHLRGNFGYATNKVIVLDEAENIRPYQSELDRPTGGIWGLVSTGIIRTQEDLDKLPDGYTIMGEPAMLGMLNYKDFRGPNSDEPDGRITSDDRNWIADYSQPPMNYGLFLGGSWKSFRVDLLFQGVGGHKVLMHTNGRDIQARAEESSYRYWADSWSVDNVDAKYPGWRDDHYRTRFPESTFWLRSGSFLRLKNLNVSYTVPNSFTKSINLRAVRVYFSGTNLALLFDSIKDWGYDPELDNIRAYPMMKSFSLGLNVDL